MQETLIDIFSGVHFVNVCWKVSLPLILIVADIISGLIQAGINDDFNSAKMRKGLYHKAGEILIIILGFIFDFSFGIDAISTSIVIYIVIMEIMSILENLTNAGIDLGPLSKILETAGQSKAAKATQMKKSKKENEK